MTLSAFNTSISCDLSNRAASTITINWFKSTACVAFLYCIMTFLPCITPTHSAQFCLSRWLLRHTAQAGLWESLLSVRRLYFLKKFLSGSSRFPSLSVNLLRSAITVYERNQKKCTDNRERFTFPDCLHNSVYNHFYIRSQTCMIYQHFHLVHRNVDFL